MNNSAKEIFKHVFFERDALSNKNDFGRVLILGGSEKYPGAAIIASKAALVSGVGYVASLVENPFQQALYPPEVVRVTREELSVHLEKLKNKLFRFDSIVFGNGLKDDEQNRNLLSFLLFNFYGFLVIDATGISILLSIGLEKLSSKDRKCEVVLTPNMVEFSKLLKDTSLYEDPGVKSKEAKQFALDHNAYLFIKYYDLMMIDTLGSEIIVAGRVSSLGRAGTGDAFAGLLGGLLASVEEDPLGLGEIAYSLLLESARSLEQVLLPGSFTITNVIDNIPKAMVYLSDEAKD